MSQGIQSSVVNVTTVPVATGTTTTTSGGSGNIVSVPIPNNSVMLMRVNASGYRTGGSAGSAGDSACFTRTARIKNVAGVVTVNDLLSEYASQDQVAWGCTIVASGTNAVVQVTGAANNNIDWAVQVFQLPAS